MQRHRSLTRCLLAVLVALTFAVGLAGPASAAPPPSARSGDPCARGDKPCWEAHIARRKAEAIWWAEVRKQQAYARLVAFAAAVDAARHAEANYPHGLCGGDLPPCYVMMRESRGDITAQNPGSTASGKWQFLDSTWDGFGGYAKARYAPERVQDAKARQLWAGGRGCSHWSACGRTRSAPYRPTYRSTKGIPVSNGGRTW